MERTPLPDLSRDELIGLSLDKAIAEIEFFWGLKLRKSPADAMLNRLAREWLPEFEALCDNSTPADDVEKDFYNLTHEILRLLREDELFTYVIHPEVPGTNNESERSLRGAAQDRRTGRTSKTELGARRRTMHRQRSLQWCGDTNSFSIADRPVKTRRYPKTHPTLRLLHAAQIGLLRT